ncbi:hypothetical protein [Mucilaginibacter sp.]
MKLRYIYTLLILISVFCFAPAGAQTRHKAKGKKPAAKVVAKKSATKNPSAKAPAKKTLKTAVVQKSAAKSLGDAAAKNTAPVDTTNKNSLSEEIVVTTDYKPVLADAVKIRRNPDLEDATPYKAPLTYVPLDVRLEQNSDIRQLDAMKMPPQRDSIPKNNFVQIGLGNLKTTYGEGYFATGPDEGLQAGGYVKHLAEQGSLYKQNESSNEVGIFGKSVGTTNSVNGRIDYKYNSNYFYGFDPLTSTSEIDPGKQHFSVLSAEGDLAKNFADVPNDFTYALKLKGYTYSDAYNARESNVVLSGFLNETVQQFYAGVAGSLDLTTQKDSLYNYNNSLLRINPYIKFQGDLYKIDAGINIVDQFGFSNSFYIFPAAKLEFSVVPKYVRLFVEAKGDVNKSTLLDFSTINPFIGQNIAIKNSVDKLDLSAGLKGTLAPGLSFKAFIFRYSVKYMPLLVSNFGPTGNKFAVVYDNGDSRINGLTGELDYKASDDVDVFGRVEFKDYQMAQQAQAWNLPKFKLTAGTTIHINNKVDITGSMLFRGTAYDLPYADALIPNSKVVPTTISAFFDLSGGVTYKATDKISIFVKANNILDRTNETWLYYPDYGFNIFGGVGYAF